MQTWDLAEMDVQARQPQVLQSRGEGRAIVLQLSAGESLQEHQVHERAWLVVVDGEIEIDSDGGTKGCGPGTLATFDPTERRAVRATSSARLLLLLAPWPGDGHPGSRG